MLLILLVDLITSLSMLRVDRLEVVIQMQLLLLLGQRRLATVVIFRVHGHDTLELHL